MKILFMLGIIFAKLIIRNAEQCPDDSCEKIINNFKSRNLTVRDCTQYKDGFYYWRIETLLTWFDAQIACREYSTADLISVHNFDQKMLLNNLATNNDDIGDLVSGSWIGLYRGNFTCSNSFIWSDGSEEDYTDFLSGEPNCLGNDEFCVEVLQYTAHGGDRTVTMGWNDYNCGNKMKSICSLKAVQKVDKMKTINVNIHA